MVLGLLIVVISLVHNSWARVLHGAQTGHISSSLAPRRIEFPDNLYRSPSGVFNPAAVYDPQRGWVYVWRLDECFYRTCGVLNTRTKALISVIPGNQSLATADVKRAAEAAVPWEFEPTAHERLLSNHSASMATYGDWRPFLWQGEVWVGHWVKIGWPVGQAAPPPALTCLARGTFGAHSCEFSTLSRLNFETKQLELKFLFEKPLQGSRLRVEKNWGFMENQGQLFIFYSTLPCTAVYKFDAAAPTAAALVTEVCYSNMKKLSRRTSLNATDSRQSGNPVPWTPPNGPPGLLAMVHTRAHFHTYAHWTLRLDPITLRVTHVSAGAVLQTDAFYTMGYMQGVLTVGSFHVLDSPQGQVMRLLLGEGDQYSAYEDIAMDRIVWWDLEADQLVRDLGAGGSQHAEPKLH